MSCSHSDDLVLILIGDSNVSQWPPKELPSVSDNVLLEHHHLKQVIFNHAKDGANMTEMKDQVQEALKELKSSTSLQHPKIFFIMCTGENDLSSGQAVDDVIASFHEVIDSIFADSSCETRPHLILFGPKFEPRLNDENYQLSEKLSAACEKLSLNVTLDHHDEDNGHHCHSDGKNIVYIDCLTKFSGEGSVSSKGSISDCLTLSCRRSKAESKYFDSDDGLRLSSEGYKVLREEVEYTLSRIICTETCIHSLDKSYLGDKIVLD